MKFKPTVFLATFVVTMGLLLGANAAQAANVKFEDPNNPTQATRIENFDIDSKRYTVVFTNTETVAADIYDAFPGTFHIDPNQSKDAADGVNEELNAAGAQTVGAVGLGGSRGYRIGFGSKEVEQSLGPNIEAVLFYRGWESETGVAPTWMTNAPGLGNYNTGEAVWAGFILSGFAPQVTIGGTVTDLQGSGLVLVNRGDVEHIVADGPFEFPTPMTPDDQYNVFVATQPTDPAQTCSVENGSGQVPTTNVTDVAVTCAAPVLTEVSKVAAEGDTIGGTVLRVPDSVAGVAINLYGLVAFGGRDVEGIDAVFTQDVKVVAEGDTIGGTVLKTILMNGGVAINHEGLVAFHGDALKSNAGTDSVAAVFTQDRVIVREGDTVPDGTLDEISVDGGVAINNLNQVAFHGTVMIGEGPETVRAVFTGSDGQDTQVVAREGSTLPDETTVAYIYESGSVAINDFDVVAFHGDTDPDFGSRTVNAVFTQYGLVAKEGDILEDGTTLNSINELGGVAINLFGDVAFHGDVEDPYGLRFPAVFTQYGLVAKYGDYLPDGSFINYINVDGGVAINLLGDVVFHGDTSESGGKKAVFISDGETIQVVAKVGDNLADGTTLKEIKDPGFGGIGVAINPYGTEVAFQGQVDNQDGTRIDAVFVGQAP